jgi:hypothetical protein
MSPWVLQRSNTDLRGAILWKWTREGEKVASINLHADPRADRVR